MHHSLVNIHSLTLSYGTKAVVKELNWLIQRDENWLLCGESGSGKSTLAKAIAGKHPANGQITIHFNPDSPLPANAIYVESWYSFKNLEGQANFYYQQRYTRLQAKETITVDAELTLFGKENHLNPDELSRILVLFRYTERLNAQLLELSSGEHKKLQLIKALWLKPQLLILDQPYTGLDAVSRQNLNDLLDEAVLKGLQYILISNDHELPESLNRYAEIRDQQLHIRTDAPENVSEDSIRPGELPSFLKQAPAFTHPLMVKMTDVNIAYGEKQVLHHINWQINSGERWLLQGHNGSGKSTLLSLINGDHPQSYANELHLFGQRRGSGESIWDIKEKIGLISPEFHWYFDTTSTVWQSVASGFYDTVGLFQQLPYSKQIQVDEILRFFDLTSDKHTLLNTLPLGKQRLTLLARTILKNPALLILDEPCQGLDPQQTQYFNLLVDEICKNGMTLIYVGHFEAQLPKNFTHRLVLREGKVVSNTPFYEIENEIAS